MSYEMGIAEIVTEDDVEGSIFEVGGWEFSSVFNAFKLSCQPVAGLHDVCQIPDTMVACFSELAKKLSNFKFMEDMRVLVRMDFDLSDEWFASLPVQTRVDVALAFGRSGLGDLGIELWSLLKRGNIYIIEIVFAIGDYAKDSSKPLYVWQSY